MNVVYRRIGGYSRKDSRNIIIKGIITIIYITIKYPKHRDKIIPTKPTNMARRDRFFFEDIL